MTPGLRSRALLAGFGLVLLALVLETALVYPKLRIKNEEIANLRQATNALAELKAELGQLKKLSVQTDELTRLRKDNQELHRLRNEVSQLREANQQASKAAQTATTTVPPAAANQLAQLQRQVQQLVTENAQLRAAQQQGLQSQAQAQAEGLAAANMCINNLRQIDGAKQQWALENRQPAEAMPEPADLEPYLRDGVPECPAGGGYTLNAVGLPPLCSVPGHVLQ